MSEPFTAIPTRAEQLEDVTITSSIEFTLVAQSMPEDVARRVLNKISAVEHEIACLVNEHVYDDAVITRTSTTHVHRSWSAF